MRDGPHSPIFDRKKRQGSIKPGHSVGTLPPCIPSLSVLGSVTTASLDGANTISKVGDDLFVSSTYGFVAVDASNPASPSVTSAIRSVSMQSPSTAALVGSYVYVFGSSVTAIIDPADTHLVPLAVGAFTGDQGVVDGSYLYLSKNGAMSVVDVTSPLAPTVVGTLTDSVLSNARGIVKSGNYCFIASSGGNRFVVVDVTTPASPSLVTSLSGSNYNNAHGLSMSGNYCFISMNSGLTVVDVSTPTAPVFSAHVNSTLVNRQRHVHDGNYVYSEGAFLGTGGGLTVFDVTTPTAPTQAASVSAATLGDTTGYFGIAKSGNYVYLTARVDDRVRVVDVTTPTAPTSAGSLTSSTAINDPVGLVVSGSALYVAAEEMISEVDISTPTSPTVTWTKYGNWFGALDSAVIGSYLFGVKNQASSGATIGGITSIDISDPTDTLPQAQFTHADLFGALAISTDGTYLYASSSSQDKVVIIDASSPTALTYVATITNATTLDGPNDIAVQGNYVYCAVGNTDRLTIVDVTTKASPTIAGNVQHATQLDLAICVAVSGNYAYVGCLTQNRLTIVDVSNPASPTIVGTLQDATNLNRPIGVAYADGKCFVNCQTANRVTVVDVSDPTTPTVLVSLQDNTNLNRLGNGIQVDAGLVYVPASIGDRVTVLEYLCVQP